MRFMDVHQGMQGLSREEFAKAHEKDLELQGREGVRFLKAWLDPAAGKAFCLSEGPDREAVQRVHREAGHATDEIYEVPVEV